MAATLLKPGKSVRGAVDIAVRQQAGFAFQLFSQDLPRELTAYWLQWLAVSVAAG